MFQQADDLIIFIGWVFHNLTLVLKQVFLPVRFVYAFLKSAISSAFATPITPDLPFSFNSDVMALFHTIPYFNFLIGGVAVAFGIIVLVVLVKVFQRV